MPCIFDLYEEDLQRFESALRAWEKRRQPPRAPAG
jgi:hypothetical protein